MFRTYRLAVFVLTILLVTICGQVRMLYGQGLVETTATMSIAQDIESKNASAATNALSDQRGGGDGSGGSAAGDTARKAKMKAAGEQGLQNGYWGPGGYISPIKLFFYIFVYLFWVFVAGWVNADTERLKNPRFAMWNMVFLFTFMFGFGPAIIVAPFFIGAPVAMLVVLVPSVIYVVSRNKPLAPHERVMTIDHIQYLCAVLLSKVGVKVKLKKNMKYEVGPPIEIEATGKNVDLMVLNSRTILARNHEGFNSLRNIMYHCLQQRATGIMFEYTQTDMQPRFQLDGVWHDLPPMPRNVADLMLESAKLLIGGNPENRTAKQGGTFCVKLSAKKYDTEMVVQGTNAGERCMLQFVVQKVPFNTLSELGMTQQIQEKVIELVNAPMGMVIFSAPPAHGLRSSMNVISRAADRFTRDFATVEDAVNPYQTVENVTKVTYDSSKGETPMTVLPDVFFREPHAVLIRDLVNLQTVELCCQEIDENKRLIITTLRSRDAAETLFRMLAMKLDPKLFATTIAAVVAQRLIRKLCTECKEPVQAPPQLLQKLGIRPDADVPLYQARSAPLPGEKRKPCPNCNDIGYVGRTAIFEILEVNNDIRKVLMGQPSVEAIRQVAFQSKQRTLFNSGAALIADGVTSVEELSRIMKM